jgi:Opioid growth factor receptor (OGFr) conserved region
MNYESQALQPHEITSMQSSTEIMGRIIKSYEMMLDFYGMRLVSAETGLLDRSEEFADRYDNLVCKPGSTVNVSRWLIFSRFRTQLPSYFSHFEMPV